MASLQPESLNQLFKHLYTGPGSRREALALLENGKVTHIFKTLFIGRWLSQVTVVSIMIMKIFLAPQGEHSCSHWICGKWKSCSQMWWCIYITPTLWELTLGNLAS